MKIEDQIKEKYRELGRLDENYSVWLTRRAPFWRIGFDYNLRILTIFVDSFQDFLKKISGTLFRNIYTKAELRLEDRPLVD